MRQRIVLTMIGLAIAAMCQAGAYQLTFKDPANTTRWYRTEISMDGSFTMAQLDEPLLVKGTVQYVSREKVTAVNANGTSSLVAEITEGALELTVGDQQVKQPLTGYKVTFKRTPTGKVTDVKVENVPEGDFTQMQILGFGDQWKLISGIGQGIEFPAGNLNEGAKWTNNSSVALGPGQNVTLTMNNILRAPRQVEGRTLLSIDSDTVLKMPTVKTDYPLGGQTFTISQSSSLSGKSTTQFSVEAGEITTTSFTGDLKMILTMPELGDEQAMAMTGTVKMTSSTTKIRGK